MSELNGPIIYNDIVQYFNGRYYLLFTRKAYILLFKK